MGIRHTFEHAYNYEAADNQKKQMMITI